jgi:hypothetical protein
MGVCYDRRIIQPYSVSLLSASHRHRQPRGQRRVLRLGVIVGEVRVARRLEVGGRGPWYLR